MELAVLRETLERCDLTFDGRDGRDARARRDAVDQHRAGPALAQAAAEARAFEIEIVTQDVE